MFYCILMSMIYHSMGCSTWNLDSCLIRFRKLQLIVIITFHKLLVPSRLCPATALHSTDIISCADGSRKSDTRTPIIHTHWESSLVEMFINSVLWLDIDIFRYCWHINLWKRRIIADSEKVWRPFGNFESGLKYPQTRKWPGQKHK